MQSVSHNERGSHSVGDEKDIFVLDSGGVAEDFSPEFPPCSI